MSPRRSSRDSSEPMHQDVPTKSSSARLWRCPLCTNQVRGPERPRRDDVRRYCLDCSKETGRLVERLCPSLDRERAVRAGRQEQRARAQAERKRQAELDRRRVGGIDLQGELVRLCRLPVFDGPSGSLAKRPPELVIRRAQRPQRQMVTVSGGRIILSAWPGRSPEHAVGWLLWGLAASYRTRTGTARLVRGLVAKAADEAWPGLDAGASSSEDEAVAGVIAGLTAGGQLWSSAR
jgi:hypothetical protein